ASGTTIDAYINGVLALSYTDSSADPYLSGAVGFTAYGPPGYYDDVTVNNTACSNQGDAVKLLDLVAKATPTPAWSLDGKTLIAVPNPSRGQTTLIYALPKDGAPSLVVSGITGAMVAEVNMPWQSAGIHAQSMDLQRLSSGIYFVQVIMDNAVVGTFKLAIIH
ncbi:MAG TPA: T9SS type A sorting domain-containing protein, partial [bacterium]|nr:T9SS type A sorting domain-containing protein [bacterium]